MSWAGCELDISALKYAMTLGDISTLLQKYTMSYDIPFKTKEGEVRLSSHALRLFNSRILITKYYEEGIARAFTQDNKGEITGRIKVIYDNTVDFLKAHQIHFPFYYHISNGEGVQIFGKLELDYTHTIVNVILDGEKVSHTKEVIKFDSDKSDRDFLEAEEISQERFDEQIKQAL